MPSTGDKSHFDSCQLVCVKKINEVIMKNFNEIHICSFSDLFSVKAGLGGLCSLALTAYDPSSRASFPRSKLVK